MKLRFIIGGSGSGKSSTLQNEIIRRAEKEPGRQYMVVVPDQFTMQHTLGNVRERSFGEIWTDRSDPLLAGLKDRKRLLPEKCRKCSWLSVCNGNFRSRAEAVSGNFWGFDPACFLTDEERAIPAPDI